MSNADALAPFASTQHTIASSLLTSPTPFDVDTVFCEIDLQKLPLFCSVVHVGGKLSHFTSQKELNTLPYLLVACHPPLFVKFANPPGGNLSMQFEDFRENLVRAFFPKIAMTCAERCPVDFNSYVESISDRDHPYAVDAFVSILKSCEVTSLFYVHYNLKSPLADASKTYLSNLMRSAVPDSYVSLDLGITHFDGVYHLPLFHLSTMSSSDHHLRCASDFNSGD